MALGAALGTACAPSVFAQYTPYTPGNYTAPVYNAPTHNTPTYYAPSYHNGPYYNSY